MYKGNEERLTKEHKIPAAWLGFCVYEGTLCVHADENEMQQSC